MIDLDAYRQRIGHTGPLDASFATLSALCALHPAHIVYENIDPLLGTAPRLDLVALQDKLLHRGRGGYCYEQNLLLWRALEGLGFEVTALAARVVWMRPPDAPTRPRTHMLLRVNVAAGDGAGSYIADVGFGSHLIDVPLRLVPDTPQPTPHGEMRLRIEGETHTVETRLHTGWVPLYRFTLEPHTAVDYEPLNWYTATHESSIFRHNLLMERVTAVQRTSLLNDRLVLRRPRLPPVIERLTTRAAFEESLRRDFGLHLPPATAHALWERVPKGLDQFVMPTT